MSTPAAEPTKPLVAAPVGPGVAPVRTVLATTPAVSDAEAPLVGKMITCTGIDDPVVVAAVVGAATVGIATI